MVKRIASPLLLTVLLLLFSMGWKTHSATPEGLSYPINLTLAGTRLYVSDLVSGVHVYDVADPTAPAAVARIPLRGNRGTAVKDDVIFASEMDTLLAIRLTGDSYEILARLAPSTSGGGGMDGGGGVWNEGGGSYAGSSFACVCTSSDYAPNYAPSPVPLGTGSSYATFALIGDYLYRVDYGALVVYDVTQPAQPKEVARRYFDWEIETIYPTESHLFVGTTRGMYIFDRSNPIEPVMVGYVAHVRACDPVVVSGPVAYVTLRGSSQCGQAPDELLCIDIQNPSAARVIAQKPVTSPYGLTVDYPYLYVSNGVSGYTLMDVGRPSEPNTLAAWTDWPTRDFIWSGSTLYVLGVDDLRLFDVTDPKQPVLRSTIEPGTS